MKCSNPINALSLSAVLGALVLSGCGGGSSPGTEREQVELNAAKVSLEPLKQSRAANFSRYLRNGLYTASVSQFANCANCMESDAAATSTPSSNFSTTNTQEAGVDELDRIKYDGEYLFMAAKPWYDAQNPTLDTPEYIKVMRRDTQQSLVEINQIALPEQMKSVRGLYQHNDKLAALGSADFFYGLPAMSFDIWHPGELKVNVAVYDVSEPQTPGLNQFLSYDGYLIESRRIGNKLYLVSAFSPTVEGLVYGATNEADKQANYDRLQNVDINQLMPKLRLADNTVRNLVEPQDCYIPQDATSADGYDSIVTLTTIDLAQPNNVQSVCINSVTNAIYASTNAIYLLGATSDEKSVLHKFDLTDNMAYVGTGNVDGTFGWRSPSFRLSEHQGKLRAVTSKWTEQGPVHKLYVFDAQAQDHKLQTLSVLPNEQRPQAIGKPNEDIYAVRFFGDKAYVVTFERIDPLYVLDVTDPHDPFIAGELEIPGFSSYLHPIGENLLLGVGQQVDFDNLPQNGGDNTQPSNPISQGAKVALFDVSNPQQPLELASKVYSHAYTPVEWDHHALTYLNISENEYRFALPMSYWQSDNGMDWYNINALHTLQVNVTDGSAQLLEHSPLQAPLTNGQLYISGSDDRSVLHGERIYYIHGNVVIEGTWGE